MQWDISLGDLSDRSHADVLASVRASQAGVKMEGGAPKQGESLALPKWLGVTGWEAAKTKTVDATGAVQWLYKPRPRVTTTLAKQLDPSMAADQGARLNLQLMRWRQMPELDLSMIERKKCLLVGSGTLGCYVARCLIAWGFRNLTFVDNGRVSASNPVR